MITFYYQIRKPIGFWYKPRLNPKSIIQPLKIFSIELTRTHYLFGNYGYYLFKKKRLRNFVFILNHEYDMP